MPYTWFAMILAGTVAAPQTVGTPPPSDRAVASNTQADPALARRTDEIVSILGGSGSYDATFAPAFRNAVPKAQFDAISTQIAAAIGKPVKVESITAITPWSARVKIGYERGSLNVEIAVDPTSPHFVIGLLAKGVEPHGASAASIAEVQQQLATLPGQTGFALARLGADAPAMIADRNGTRPIAIGSAFKLVILAELVRSVEANERKWSDVVTLDGSALPGGGYAQQPKGTRIRLRELAERMISVSDNSATDILLFNLGRPKVEAMLPVVGMTDGGVRNVPFLGALELFKLKGVEGGALGTRYLALAPAARRAFLDGPVRETPITAIPRDLFQDGRPIRTADLEWFASPNDLIRTMDWLRRHMGGPTGADLRAVLSKNPGLPEPATHWRYVAYKGGSEPGVLTMAFLLQGSDGAWYAMAGGVNDPDHGVDTLRFTGLIGRALELAAPR